MNISLSVIIPTYNEESTIGACLEAIFAQTDQAGLPEEIIVVDNNSADRTVAIARGFKGVKVISEKRQGLYYARNTGMDAARGNIIARIDADTIVTPAWAAAIRRAMSDPEVSAVSGPVGYYDMPFQAFSLRAEDVGLRFAKAANYDFLMGANMAIRSGAWRLVRDNLCNETFLFEDIDIAVHLAELGIYPAYSTEMQAKVSSRRMADKPADFMRYIGGHTRTVKHHGYRPSAGVYYAEGAFKLLYLGVKPLHMVYDPELGRPSLRRLLRPGKARPDPMATAARTDK